MGAGQAVGQEYRGGMRVRIGGESGHCPQLWGPPRVTPGHHTSYQVMGGIRWCALRPPHTD